MKWILLVFYFFLPFSSETPISKEDYKVIYSFGDSLTDTGNFLHTGALAFPAVGRLPYGETYFRHPTGRCSDGRLVVDFIAEELGLHYLPPYLSLHKGQHSPQGVNFAVAGATALNPNAFREFNLQSLLWTNYSLSLQFQWFKTYKSSICSTKQDSEKFFKKSLFIVGEIGGNDYNYMSILHSNISQLTALVPRVVDTISEAVTNLIEEGATSLLIPGNLPVGCSAMYLTLFESLDKSDYDGNGCLKAYNAFARYHNAYLKFSLKRLRVKYPNTKIMYGDFYGAAMQFYHAPQHHGFIGEEVLKACCGGGGPYNFNHKAMCGTPNSKVCDDPSTYPNWDGIHLTETAYAHIARTLLHHASSFLSN